MKPTLLVLAAGMGSRYGGLKQIDSFGPFGETILEYSVFDAIRAGFGKICFVIRRDIEDEFKQKVSSKFEKIIPIEYTYQSLEELPSNFTLNENREKPWGTGHAVWTARNAIKEPFGMINADDFYGKSAFVVLADFLNNMCDSDPLTYTLIGYHLKNTLSDYGMVSRGVCEVDENSFLTSIIELTKIAKTSDGPRFKIDEFRSKPLNEDTVTSMNLFGFSPKVFEFLDNQLHKFLESNINNPKIEFYIPEAIGAQISDGVARVKVISTDEKWFGVTYTEDKENFKNKILECIESGDYPEKLWS